MSSTTLCGVCSQQPSRYKCPACQLPYCSLVCYKTHKPIHVIQDSQAEDSVDRITQSVPNPSTNTTASSSAPAMLLQPQLPVRARPNLQNVLASPAITSFLSSNPTLSLQLRQIYAVMLPPSDPNSTYNSTSNTNTSRHNVYHPYHSRGRGGRGRGRGRGGQYGQQNARKAPWTQDRAEEEAVKLVSKLREVEDEEVRVLEEFVKIVKEVVGGFEVVAASGAQEEDDSEMVTT